MPTQRRLIERTAALLIAALMGVAPALAEPEGPPPDNRWTLSGVLENDLFAGTDRHYTNGVLMSALSPQDETLGLPPDWWRVLPGHKAAAKRRIGMHLGQSMFTPDPITVAAPLPNDRPYAAWLHGGISLVSESRRELRQLSLDLGVVGPVAMGEEAQSFVHDVIGSDEPQGWDNQLGNEPTLTLSYDHRWQNVLQLRPEAGGLGIDMMPHVSAALGNALTYAGAGATFRFGDDLPNDFGPLSIRPGSMGSALYRPQGGFSWYLFAGAEARAVARNIFLDGNSFQDSPSVSKKPLVGDLTLGASVAYDSVRLTYSYVMRSKEFDGQGAVDKFASLTLTLKF